MEQKSWKAFHYWVALSPGGVWGALGGGGEGRGMYVSRDMVSGVLSPQ